MTPNRFVSIGSADRLIRDESDSEFDLIITSPPYWGLRTYGLPHNTAVIDEWAKRVEDPSVPPALEWYLSQGGQLGQEPYPEWFISNLVSFFELCAPKLKQHGSLWINLGDTYFARWSSIRERGRQGLGDSNRTRRRTPAGGWRHDKQLLQIPARLAIAMQDRGWILRNDLIWSKEHVAPRPEKDRLRASHEHFYHFVQRTPSSRPTYYYDLSAAEDGCRDVVVAPKGKSVGAHTATFPTELIKPRIESSCPPGGNVLDPFCGTGTTLVAALASGRNARGYELSQEVADSANARIEDFVKTEEPGDKSSARV